MKLTKDKMNSPLSTLQVNKYLDLYKSIGATHVDVSTVIGHPEFAFYTKLWMDAVHAKGMFVTLRSAHQNMEGLYGVEKFVGANRKPAQFWIDEAVNALKDLPWKAGDEIAIYPERTEGIFSDDTAFLFEGLPGSYGEFFKNLHEAIRAVAPAGVVVGLSANNASELLSGWMPIVMSDTYGVVVVDLYVDGDPVKYEADIRAIYAKYGKPMHVQESAVHRFETPDKAKADAYYAVNKKLADEGILYGYGAWGGWAGNPESVITDTGLTPAGESLKSWWSGVVTPTPVPAPVTDLKPVLDKIEDLRKAVDSRDVLELAEAVIWGPGTLSERMRKLKVLIPDE